MSTPAVNRTQAIRLPDVWDPDSIAGYLMSTDCPVFSADDFGSLAWRAGRNCAPRNLLYAWMHRKISRETLTASIGEVWSMAEWPLEFLPRQWWLDLFTAAGYTHDGKAASRPDALVRVYRGSTHRLRRRWSWTADRERAQWFADRYAILNPGATAVYVTDAPPSALLAYIGPEAGRGEDEYVVNTTGLKIRPTEHVGAPQRAPAA